VNVGPCRCGSSGRHDTEIGLFVYHKASTSLPQFRRSDIDTDSVPLTPDLLLTSKTNVIKPTILSKHT
jgi:hypothetical protein